MAKVTADRPINLSVAGVRFVDGEADTDDVGALAYFRRRSGYTVEAPKRRRASKKATAPTDKGDDKGDGGAADDPTADDAPDEEVDE